jgi:large subunit ribosomal protein L32
MAVPKKRRSHARTRTYHAAWKAKAKNSSTCKNCGSPVLPHTVCDNCGFYGGKKVMVTKTEKRSIKKASKKEESK